MSEHTEQIAALYEQLATSAAGKHLIEWIEKTTKETREHAGKSEPTKAWGELRFADGMTEVLTHITQMRSMKPRRKAS